jgi:hypothetical protein
MTRYQWPSENDRRAMHRAAERQGTMCMRSYPIPGDGIQAPGWVVLCRFTELHAEQWVTWFYNAQDRGLHQGDYTQMGEEVAVQMYERRCARHKGYVQQALSANEIIDAGGIEGAM